MLCDFMSGVSIVSSANIVPAQANMCESLSIRFLACKKLKMLWTATRVVFEALHAGSWHNRFPGETRVQPDLAGLVSFYDTQLVPSLVAGRVGQERRHHRVRDVSKEDLSAALSRLGAALIRPSGLSSGIDWRTLIQVVVDRYAGRLELTHHLLNSPATSPDEILDLASMTQTQLRIMLTPYILFSATPTDPSDKVALDWAAPIYKHCGTAHTTFMESELDSMTDSEKLLLRAVRGTSQEICRVVTKMWAAGVYAGIDPSLNTKESLDIAEVTHIWNTWGEDLNRLMTWLDWSVWVKCNPACGPEVRLLHTHVDVVYLYHDQEICFVHKWPANFGTSFDLPAMDSFTNGVWNTVKPDSPDEWIAQPKCISRVDP